MDNYVQKTFARMNLAQIHNFILYGTEGISCPQEPYKDKLKKRSDAIYKRLRELYPDQAERESAEADLANALTAYEQVYFEMGMKAGARILYQLLSDE